MYHGKVLADSREICAVRQGTLPVGFQLILGNQILGQLFCQRQNSCAGAGTHKWRAFPAANLIQDIIPRQIFDIDAHL